MTLKLLPTMVLGFGVGLISAVSGCGSAETDSPDTAATPETGAQVDSNHDHSDHVSASHSDKTDMEKMNEALADFSEEDRQSATKQHSCPVTNAMLGSMGAPKKVDVGGTSVWICCDGCKDKLLADPDKYLAKLNN